MPTCPSARAGVRAAQEEESRPRGHCRAASCSRPRLPRHLGARSPSSSSLGLPDGGAYLPISEQRSVSAATAACGYRGGAHLGRARAKTRATTSTTAAAPLSSASQQPRLLQGAIPATALAGPAGRGAFQRLGSAAPPSSRSLGKAGPRPAGRRPRRRRARSEAGPLGSQPGPGRPRGSLPAR